MLAVSPLKSLKNERESQMQENEFPDFKTDENLLDSIDFDEFFVGIRDGDVLPDLEMDPEILAECKDLDMNIESVSVEKTSVSCSGSSKDPVPVNPCPKEEAHKGRKSSSVHSKNLSGKRKVKVEWTPELHRRFVQAVEQLGVDKAVPSRILEIMGIDCLTRHNIASHLQKYRSHRKHLLAREAEAASWNRRRQMPGMAVVAAGGVGKREVNPWIVPATIGFPPVTPMPHFRVPLHVWGHPSVDQSLFMQMWPPISHSLHLQPPSPNAAQYPQYVPTPGTPCFPPHLPPMRFLTPPVPGIPPPGTYNVDPSLSVRTLSPPPSDVHPSKESIDAAIGDVLTKPWLPLPLGLKPPSTDSVMIELQREGISKIPPT